MSSRNAVPGDVCQLRLDDGRYAYGRVLRDASIAVYRTTTDAPGMPPIGEREFMFTVGVYEDVPGSSACPIVARDPFDSEAEEWPPPYTVVDPIGGNIQIYHLGEIRPAERPEEADKLEPAAVWDLHHLLERIRRELQR